MEDGGYRFIGFAPVFILQCMGIISHSLPAALWQRVPTPLVKSSQIFGDIESLKLGWRSRGEDGDLVNCLQGEELFAALGSRTFVIRIGAVAAPTLHLVAAVVTY